MTRIDEAQAYSGTPCSAFHNSGVHVIRLQVKSRSSIRSKWHFDKPGELVSGSDWRIPLLKALVVQNNVLEVNR
jgi:hypothetical protein